MKILLTLFIIFTSLESFAWNCPTKRSFKDLGPEGRGIQIDGKFLEENYLSHYSFAHNFCRKKGCERAAYIDTEQKWMKNPTKVLSITCTDKKDVRPRYFSTVVRMLNSEYTLRTAEETPKRRQFATILPNPTNLETANLALPQTPTIVDEDSSESPIN